MQPGELPGDPGPVAGHRSSLACSDRVYANLPGIATAVPARLANHVPVITQHNPAIAFGALR